MIKHLIFSSCFIFLIGCKDKSKTLSHSEKASLRGSLNIMMLESIESLAKAHNNPEFIASVKNNERQSVESPIMTLTNPLSNIGNLLRQKLLKVWRDAGSSTCNILRPYILKASKNKIKHPYFFVGTAVTAGVGIHGVKGRDIVWDFYNSQASSFNYEGKEIVLGASSIGAGVSTYVGIAFGNKPDVKSAWSGRFVSASIEASLPLLANYLSIGGTGFSSATTEMADMQIIGANISVQGAISVPNPLPGSLGVQTGVWSPDLKTNAKISNILKTKNIAHTTTGIESCSGACLKFQKPEGSISGLTQTSALLNSIPLVAVNSGDSPYFPGYPELAVVAYATTLYKNVPDANQACNFN